MSDGYDEIDDFVTNSADGLETVKVIQSTASCFVGYLCRCLLNHSHCVLVSKPLEMTMTSGIGEEGELLSFQVMAPNGAFKGLKSPKIYPLHLNNQLFHMADYPMTLPLFSYAYRSYQVPVLTKSGCPKESNIICLPPQLCRLFMSIFENKSPPTDEDLEKFTSGVFDGLICHRFPEVISRTQGGLESGSLLIH